MKIICINNSFDILKSNNSEPIFFLKPDTSLLKNNKAFFIPHFSKTISCGLSPVIRINRVGKNIPEKFAYRYYDEVGIGLDLTDVSMHDKCKKNNLPWEAAKAFEGSSPIGLFIKKDEITNFENTEFLLLVNETIVQKIKIENMNFSVSRIISHISQFFTIKTGDLIFLGTPELSASVNINDRIKAFMGDNLFLDFYIR